MKGNKKLLIVAVLLLLITVSFTTYAIYRQSATATGTVTAAAWHVEVDGHDLATTQTITLDLSSVVWNTNPSKVAGKIAPGATGTITIPVDATGSEVDVIVEAALGNIASKPDGMTVALASGSNHVEIPYAASNMTGNVTINVTWTGELSDVATKDENDLSFAGEDIQIPVVLTARQKVASELD